MKASDWISVDDKDQLPKVGDFVWAWFDGVGARELCRCENGDWQYYRGNLVDEGDVTHWMPIVGPEKEND